MARYDFGGTLADFVVTSRHLGGLDVLGLSAATLTFWSAQTGGTKYTDLVLNGSAASSISVGTDGQVPKFQGPDGITEMWADGGSPRVRVVTLQGAPGPAGKDGTNGLPGVNAVANDTATGGYVGTLGSATRAALDAAYTQLTSVAATVTASATLTANRHTPVDATSAARTMTLPTTAAVGALISVEKTDATANAVTVSGTMRGVAASTIPLTTQYDARTFLSEGSGSWRPVSDHRTTTSLNSLTTTQMQTFSASRYLRTGLGTADDTATLNAALADTQTTTVIVPAGVTVNVVGTITVPAAKTLILEDGSKLLRSGAGTGRVVTMNTGSVLTGTGTVDGLASTTTFVIGLNGGGVTIRGVTVKGGTYGIGSNSFANVTVELCTFTGLTSYAWLCEGTSTYPVFRNNRITASGQGVQYKSPTTDGVISGNLVNITGGVGIELFGTGVDRCSVTNNVVTGTPSIGISMASATNCVVSGNTVGGHATIGIENAEGATNNTITGNTVRAGSSASTGVGISLTTSNPTTKPLTNVTVSGNTITDQTLYGIDCTDGFNINVTGNTIRNSKVRAIWFRGTATGCVISSNTMYQDTTDVINYIRIAGTSFLVTGNLMRSSAVVAGSEAIRLEGGGGGHTIEGNVMENVATGVGVNNCPATILNNNRTKGTTSNSLNFFPASSLSSTSRVLTHIYTLTSGAAIANSAVATVTGPSMAV